MTQADREEGTLEWVGRPQVAPVLGGEVVEGQEDVTVIRVAVACGLVLRVVLFLEVVEGPSRHLHCLGEPDLVKVTPLLCLESLGQTIDRSMALPQRSFG